MPAKPLNGLRVLDLTRLLPGAVATQYFADQGAEVVKIEQPGAGDYARTLNAAVFARTNSGKRSVSLDLKQARGREILVALAATADILLEGFRPGVMARLGLSYADLSPSNPALIYASLTGYGQTGEYAGLAGHDINYLALGGVLSLNLPVIPGVQIADIAGGSMQTIIGVLLALQARARTGQGSYVDISMTAGIAPLLTIPLATYAATGRDPQAGQELLSGGYACYNLYQAAGDQWIAVGALEPKFWAALCRRLACEDLIAAQFAGPARQREMKARLASLFRARSAAEWFEELRGDDCCVTPVRSVAQVAAETPPAALLPAPALGEHTRAILLQHGIAAPELDELYRQGVIA